MAIMLVPGRGLLQCQNAVPLSVTVYQGLLKEGHMLSLLSKPLQPEHWVAPRMTSLLCLLAKPVPVVGAGDHKASGKRHLKMEAPSRPPCHEQPAGLPRQAAAFVLLGPVRDTFHFPPECHRRLLQLHQRCPAATDLCRAQQVCYLKCSQTGVHRGYPDEAVGHSGTSQQCHELQQPALRVAEKYRDGNQGSRLELSQHSIFARNGGQSDRTLPLRPVV